MTIPNRTFGIELEIKGLEHAQIISAIQAAGFEAAFEGYTHRVTSHWKVVTDASVTGGYEVVSPILRGEEGIQAAKKVARALASAGARVDRSCGFHVHVGVRDFTGPQLATILQRYSQFEATIDEFMPRSRRANNNLMCSTVRHYATELQGCTIPASSSRVAGMFGNRYVKVNTQSYHRYQTLEFRQHSGTCTASKIENWVRFLLYFVEASKNRAPELRAEDRRVTGGRRGGLEAKLDRVLAALEAAGWRGLRNNEIAELGGWSTASVAPYITRLRQQRGVTIWRDRVQGTYYLAPTHRAAGVRARAGGDPVVTTERVQAARRVQSPDAWHEGIPSDVVSFFEERRQELGPDA